MTQPTELIYINGQSSPQAATEFDPESMLEEQVSVQSDSHQDKQTITVSINRGKDEIASFLTTNIKLRQRFLTTLSGNCKNQITVLKFKIDETNNDSLWSRESILRPLSEQMTIKHPSFSDRLSVTIGHVTYTGRLTGIDLRKKWLTVTFSTIIS